MGLLTSILGLGRGKTNANLALKGFEFAKGDPTLTTNRTAGAGASGALAALLGLGGDPAAADSALQSFANSPGFKFIRDRALGDVTASAAAGGELNSGATLKALQDRAGGLAQTTLSQYLANLAGLADRGQQASLGVAAAGTSGGGTAASTQPQNKGILGRFFGI